MTPRQLHEVNNIEKWTETNRMLLNLDKTWEMVVSVKSTNPLPEPIAGIERKTWLKLLGTTLQNDRLVGTIKLIIC